MSNFGFVKIFGSLLSSTVWVGQPWHRKLMWITMLVKADQDGYVASSIPGLARDAEVTLEQAEDALAHFMAPDRYSRTKDFEGIRIEEVDGGWVLLNHKKYRELRSREAVLNARRVAKHKAKRKAEQTGQPAVAESAERPASNAKGRRRAPPISASVTSVTSVSANASNDQKQIQISEADPDPDPDDQGGAKDRSSSARARAAHPASPPSESRVAIAQAPMQPVIASHTVPADWSPKPHHEINARLYGLDFETEVDTFRATTFRATYWDWDKRFDRWLLDRRVDKQTADFKRQQHGPPRASPFAGLRPQPNNGGVTGWESVEAAEAAEAAAAAAAERDDDGEAAE